MGIATTPHRTGQAPGRSCVTPTYTTFTWPVAQAAAARHPPILGGRGEGGAQTRAIPHSSEILPAMGVGVKAEP
jgi:hypothetical protein